MNNYENDDDLARGLREGDPAAAEAMVRRFQVRLMKFAISRRFSEQEAVDLAQDAIAEGWMHIASFRQGESMWRWLAGIEMNLMRRVWDERKKALPSTDGLVGTSGELPAPPGRVSRELSAELAVLWAHVQLNLTLMRNQKYSAAVQLRYIDEMSYEDIAQAIELGSPESAREYVRRGLAQLREMLDADAPEEPPMQSG